MDMHMQMQLPEPQYRGKCKLLLLGCVVLMVVFFICGFLPYFNYAEGDVIEAKGVTFTVNESDEFSLMTYMGFPDEHKLLSDFHKEGYKQEVFDYKVVNISDVGCFLFLEVFALLMTVLILIKASMGKALVAVIWGVVGTIGLFVNNVFQLGNTFVRPVMIVMVIAELVLAVAAFALYYADSHRVSAYLKSVSAVYK